MYWVIFTYTNKLTMPMAKRFDDTNEMNEFQCREDIRVIDIAQSVFDDEI